MPRGSFHQNMLRARYQMTRAHALGAKSDGPLWRARFWS